MVAVALGTASLDEVERSLGQKLLGLRRLDGRADALLEDAVGFDNRQNPTFATERIARWGNVWFYDEYCGTPRRPPPRKSQKTVVLLEAVLAHFIAGKDVSQWLLPK
jgi:hypothetical protein